MRHRLAIVLDPRFPGGTAASVAEELRAMRGHVELHVAALDTTMFEGQPVNPRFLAALDEAGIKLDWNPRVIRGDTIVFHNPSCLRFGIKRMPRMSCNTAYVITHENFLRPSGSEGFDVAGCIGLIERALVAGRMLLAPVSKVNRRGVETWLAQREPGPWTIAPFDWFNICSGPFRNPTVAPRDRRGRHSRPGFEKFPPWEAMLRHFPPHAEHCLLLGVDGFLQGDRVLPRHWQAVPFGAMPVEQFLDAIDFFVYFTNPLWRESFGRVIAEAIAAGKLVITDPETAETFGPGVVASTGDDVDEIVAGFIAEPQRYGRAVRQAQADLARLSPDEFRERVLTRVTGETPLSAGKAATSPAAATGAFHARL